MNLVLEGNNKLIFQLRILLLCFNHININMCTTSLSCWVQNFFVLFFVVTVYAVGVLSVGVGVGDVIVPSIIRG